MQGNAKYTITVHLSGTLSADAQGTFKLPQAATLVSVQAVGSNANNGILTIGTSADADGILTAGDIGDSGVPAVFDRNDWDGDLYEAQIGYVDDIAFMHLAKDTIVKWSLDHDGDGGTAAQNVTIIFFFDEG